MSDLLKTTREIVTEDFWQLAQSRGSQEQANEKSLAILRLDLTDAEYMPVEIKKPAARVLGNCDFARGCTRWPGFPEPRVSSPAF